MTNILKNRFDNMNFSQNAHRNRPELQVVTDIGLTSEISLSGSGNMARGTRRAKGNIFAI
jgi:hypothetical protein